MPDGNVLELRSLAFGDEGDKAFGIFVALMMRFDDVGVHRSTVMVAANFDGDAVP